ncbi:ERMES complex subunit [Nowakowskiella sp. JEL0078]|nr:ERMES complex subunit [Nowakowskiella sp. JEL0078]
MSYVGHKDSNYRMRRDLEIKSVNTAEKARESAAEVDMSFKINWPKFSAEFIEKAKEQVTVALNNGEKPAKIVDNIIVKDLNMGSKVSSNDFQILLMIEPPDLEILEIGDLAEERFRGIFKLTYAGDASVVLLTKVQANPLIEPKTASLLAHHSGILAANRPLVVPMELRISNLKLRGIVVLVIDKQRGVTLVFKNDPLEKVDVNSTFDNIPNIRRFLQKQIEGQLRKLFQDDLPQLIHNLSLLKFGDKDDISGKTITPADALFDPDENVSFHSEIGNLINRPYHQKWTGNDPVDGYCSDFDAPNGYVLYRSLTTSFSSDPSDIGLHRLFEQNKSRNAENLEQRSRIFWPWLKGKEESDSELQSKTVINAITLTAPRNSEILNSQRLLSPAASLSRARNGYSNAEKSQTYNDNASVYSTKSAPAIQRTIITQSVNHADLRSSRSDILEPTYTQTPEESTSPREIRTHFKQTTHLYNQNTYTPPPTLNPPLPAPESFNSIDKIVLQPTDNAVTAHLANLLTNNHTFFPFTHAPQHFTYRSSPPSRSGSRQANHQKQTSTGTSTTTSTLIDHPRCASDNQPHMAPPDYTITPASGVVPNAPSPHRKKSGMRRMRVPTSAGVALTQSASTSSLASFGSTSQKSSTSGRSVASNDESSDTALKSSLSEPSLDSEIRVARANKTRSVGAASTSSQK